MLDRDFKQQSMETSWLIGNFCNNVNPDMVKNQLSFS